MNTQDIVDLKDELVERDAPRHAKYDVNMAAIGGSYDNRRMEGFWNVYQAITGRQIPSDREQAEFNINFIPSIIQAKRSFIGTIPSLQVPPAVPPTPEDKKPKQRAEKLERVYQGFWTYSLIGKRMNQLGYWNPALGSTVGVVWPDVENKRPVLQMRSPYGAYPVLADTDGQDLYQLIFVTKYKPRQAAAMFPEFRAEILAYKQPVDVLQYIDRERLVTIVGDRYRTKDIENKWGFVNAVIIPNEAFGEGPWGDADIDQVIPVQEEYVYREMLKTAILEQTIMQPLAIEGGENLPAQIPMGPRDAIPVQVGGRVYRVPPVQVPYQYLQSQADLIKLIDRVGSIPEVMRSQFEGNVLTGKGVSTLMGPTQMAFNVKGNEIYPAIATLNKMAMRMWHKMWPRARHTVYAMEKGNKVSVESFKTGEFEGWYENIVYVDASSYFDAQSRFVMVLQAVQNRLMSRQTAMQFVPGVSDAPGEAELIKSELQEDMDMQKANEARDEANVQPSMGAQGYTNSMLQKGYAGKTPPPEAIGGLEVPGGEGEQQAPEQEQEQGTLLQDMVEFFTQVPLKGRVWLVGGIVSDPGYSPESPAYNGVEVSLEDMNDKSAINTTMRNEYPEVHGHLVYHEGPPSSQEPSILVYDPDAEELPDVEQAFGEPEENMGAPSNTGVPQEMGGQAGDIEALMAGLGGQM